jgi:hypothetical protein
MTRCVRNVPSYDDRQAGLGSNLLLGITRPEMAIQTMPAICSSPALAVGSLTLLPVTITKPRLLQVKLHSVLNLVSTALSDRKREELSCIPRRQYVI